MAIGSLFFETESSIFESGNENQEDGHVSGLYDAKEEERVD